MGARRPWAGRHAAASCGRASCMRSEQALPGHATRGRPRCSPSAAPTRPARPPARRRVEELRAARAAAAAVTPENLWTTADEGLPAEPPADPIHLLFRRMDADQDGR